jgi:hypothetical protein
VGGDALTRGGRSHGRRRIALAALLAAIGAAATAHAETVWRYAKLPDPATTGERHTLQTQFDYDGAAVILAFICVQGRLVLTLAATWPIAPVLRYRFPPEAPRWIQGSSPLISQAVFQGEEVRALFETALVRSELLVRIPGPRTISERTLDLAGFAEKAQPLRDACSG